MYSYIETIGCITIQNINRVHTRLFPPPYLAFDRRHVVTQNHDHEFFVICNGHWSDKSVGTRRWVLSCATIINIISFMVFCSPRKFRLVLTLKGDHGLGLKNPITHMRRRRKGTRRCTHSVINNILTYKLPTVRVMFQVRF